MPLPTSARGRRGAALALPSLLLAACSGQGGSPSGSSATPAPVAKPDLVAHLDNMPQGTARLDVDARTRRIVAHLAVTGLAPTTAHAVQLHRGSCLKRGGDLVTAFPDALSSAAGAMTVDLQATSAATMPAGVYIELHLVGAAALGSAVDPQSIPIACSDISATAPATAVRIAGTPGYKPFGTASLTYASASHTVKATLNLQAFVGGSVHGVQILSGTCAAPGAPVHTLADLATDANGTATTAQTVKGFDAPPPASGWILVVRTGPGAAAGPLAQPLLCGPLSKPA